MVLNKLHRQRTLPYTKKNQHLSKKQNSASPSSESISYGHKKQLAAGNGKGAQERGTHVPTLLDPSTTILRDLGVALVTVVMIKAERKLSAADQMRSLLQLAAGGLDGTR